MNMRPVDKARIREEEAGDDFAECLYLELSPESYLPKLPKIVKMMLKSIDLKSPPG